MSNTWLPFPQRVYNTLKLCEDQGREDILSWENNGTAFKVNDLEEFERDLLPRYFNTKKYNTFTRALYAYGFTCVRTGRQPGICEYGVPEYRDQALRSSHTVLLIVVLLIVAILDSHPSFNRNDPLSPSLIKRKPTKKSASKRADANPSLEALMNNHHSSRRPGILNGHPAPQKFPALVGNKTGRENDGDTSVVFGRSYHTIPYQGAALVTSTLPPVQIPAPPAGTESWGTRDSMNMRSYTDLPTPSTSTWTTSPTSFHAVTNSNANVLDDRHIQGKPISPNDSHFILESCQKIMAPIVSPVGRPSRATSDDLEQFTQSPKSMEPRTRTQYVTAKEVVLEGCDLLLHERYGEDSCRIVARLIARFENLPIHKMCNNHSGITARELQQYIEDQGDESLPAVDEFGMTPFHVLFSTIDPSMEFLEVLLELLIILPTPLVLQWQDANHRKAVDYLLIKHWTTDGASTSLVRMILQKTIIDILARWGSKSWIETMQSMMQDILVEDDEDQRIVLCNEAYSALEHYTN